MKELNFEEKQKELIDLMQEKLGFEKAEEMIVQGLTELYNLKSAIEDEEEDDFAVSMSDYLQGAEIRTDTDMNDLVSAIEARLETNEPILIRFGTEAQFQRYAQNLYNEYLELDHENTLLMAQIQLYERIFDDKFPKPPEQLKVRRADSIGGITRKMSELADLKLAMNEVNNIMNPSPCGGNPLSIDMSQAGPDAIGKILSKVMSSDEYRELMKVVKAQMEAQFPDEPFGNFPEPPMDFGKKQEEDLAKKQEQKQEGKDKDAINPPRPTPVEE